METAIKPNQYKWKKTDSSEYDDWHLRLFSKDELSSIKKLSRKVKSNGKELPFIRKEVNIAPHIFQISIFEPRPYERRYEKKLLKQDKDTITFKKEFLSDYEGDIDAELSLIYEDWLDWETRAIAYFLNGEMKDSYEVMSFTPSGKHYKTSKEFRDYLTDYFKKYCPSFGEHLENFVMNSNLPQRQRDAIKGILK